MGKDGGLKDFTYWSESQLLGVIAEAITGNMKGAKSILSNLKSEELGLYDSDKNLIFGKNENTDEFRIFQKIDVGYSDWYIGVQTAQEYEFREILKSNILGTGFTIILFVSLTLWIFYYVNNNKLIQEQEQLIYYDSLTGLPNRLLFEMETNELIDLEQEFYLGFGDLDNFKNINDILGHSVGDQYLHFATENLRGLLTEDLRIYRWGGDEFIFVFLNTDKIKLHETMDKIFSIFKEPYEIKDSKHQISISIGVVEYPLHGSNIDSLVKRADIVMYDIKSQHKNTYSFFEQKYLDELLRQVRFQQTIEKYDVEDFEIYMQPIVDVHTNEVKGLEGLARLFDGNGNQFPTYEIIKLYEKDGTITKLDKYIFNKICTFIKDCNRDLFYTFNLSPISLTNEYVDFLEQTISKHNIKPSKIVIEIIETLGFKDLSISIELLDRIKSIGFNIAMDDFGMGYSSLSYITKMPLDIIKIDRSFIHNYENNTFNRTILQTIKDISKSLHLEILVEGIETESQLEHIKGLDAQYYQGYLHSKPMSMEKVKELMKSNKK